MSKSIALGLPGAGALLLAILLAGCAGAPAPRDGRGRSHSLCPSTARSHAGTDALTGAHGVGGR